MGSLKKPKVYEFMCVAYQGLLESEVENLVRGLVASLEELGITVLEEKIFGLLDFAYEIKKHKRGYYFLLLLRVPRAQLLDSFSVKLRVNELIVRHCFILLKDESYFKPEIVKFVESTGHMGFDRGGADREGRPDREPHPDRDREAEERPLDREARSERPSDREDFV